MTAPMMVLVYAPIGAAQSAGIGGSFPVPEGPVFTSELVGFLPLVVDSGESEARAKAEAEACGCTFDAVVRTNSDTPGYIAANVAWRVTAPSVTKARDLPGFQSLYMHSAEQYYPIIDMERMWGGDAIRCGDGIREHHMPADAPLPRYGADGAAAFSLLPRGQISTCVFLKDAPDVWYAVYGSPATATDEAAVSAVRAFRG